MGRKKKLIDKVVKKKFAGGCYFCGNDDYAQLNVHRINFKEEVNEYTEFNTVVVCANCHCKIHDEQIIIDRKYYSTSGKWMLHYWTVVDGIKNEFWR